MRQHLCAGLAAVAVSGAPVAADPATPQLSPLHRQREDAQRLRDEQRELDRPQPSAPSAPAKGPAPPAPSGGTRHTTRNAGLVLLGIAGLSTVVALPLRTFDGPDDDGGTATSTSNLLLVTAAITATGGLVLVLSDRSLSVAPAVTARSVGVTLMGRI
jgi:hypothetical protein